MVGSNLMDAAPTGTQYARTLQQAVTRLESGGSYTLQPLCPTPEGGCCVKYIIARMDCIQTMVILLLPLLPMTLYPTIVTLAPLGTGSHLRQEDPMAPAIKIRIYTWFARTDSSGFVSGMESSTIPNHSIPANKTAVLVHTRWSPLG